MDYCDLPKEIREPMENCMHHAEQSGVLARYTEDGLKLEATIRHLLVLAFCAGHHLCETSQEGYFQTLDEKTLKH